MFSGLRCESCFHLLESSFQQGFVDEGITERPFKVVQSRENSGDIFTIRLSVHRFIAQMGQALRSTVGDQFLNRGLGKETCVECFTGYRECEKNKSPFLGVDIQAVS